MSNKVACVFDRPEHTIFLEPEVVEKLLQHISRISLYKGIKAHYVREENEQIRI